jgi:hypothetical protein
LYNLRRNIVRSPAKIIKHKCLTWKLPTKSVVNQLYSSLLIDEDIF